MSFASDIAEPGLQADQRLLNHAWLRIGVGLAVVGQAMVFSLAVNLTPPEGPAYWILHGGLMLSAAAGDNTRQKFPTALSSLQATS